VVLYTTVNVTDKRFVVFFNSCVSVGVLSFSLPARPWSLP
jgi:hypothetical protein